MTRVGHNWRRHRAAFDEGTSFLAGRAAAYRDVVGNRAHCIMATCPWTGVGAFIANARLISGAFGVDDAFGPAAGVWIALIFGQTAANAVVATRVRAARRWIAWVCLNLNLLRRWLQGT